MKQIKFTENGPVLVEQLEVANIELPKHSEEDLFKAYKDTLIFAIKKRINYCMKDLEENTNRIISSNTSSILYTREDNTINQFNYPTYKAMEESLPLIENDEFDKLAANQWEQIVKALYWVKPLNKDGFTFSQLITWCIDKLCTEISNLIAK